jgi:hypothetical protein
MIYCFSHLYVFNSIIFACFTGNFGVVNLATYKGNEIACKQMKETSTPDSVSISDALKTQSKVLKDFLSEAKVIIFFDLFCFFHFIFFSLLSYFLLM